MTSRLHGLELLGVISLFLLLPFQGCIGGQDTIEIPAPRVGSWFQYDAPNGERLNLTVGPVEPRLDASLIPRNLTKVEINWSVPFGDGERATNLLHEFLDPSTGAVVQFHAPCIGPLHLTEGVCPEPVNVIVFGPGRLSGAFGTASLWGETFEPGSAANVTMRALNGSLDPVQVELGTPGPSLGPGDTRTCATLGFENQEIGANKRLLHAVTTGPVVVCNGLPAVAAFENTNGTTFTLTRWAPGAGPPIELPSPSAWDLTPVVDLVPWRRPLLASTDLPDSPFTVAEAHEFAIAESPAYANFFEEYTDAIVAGSDRAKISWTGGENEGSRTTRRVLQVTSATGEGLEATLDKETSFISTGDWEVVNRSEIRIVSVEPRAWDRAPTQQSAADRQAGVAEAIPVGEMLTGAPFTQWIKHMITYHNPFWAPHVDEGRQDGFSLVTHHRGPEVGEVLSGIIQLRSVTDGPTGLVDWAEVYETQVPLIDNIEHR